MQDWSTPLIIATAGFLVVLLWRVRPLVPGRRPGASREAIREAKARVEEAADDHARALALCDAADLLNPGGAKGLYIRAIRADPGSVQVVQRAVAALARRPRTLESLLWRQLAAKPWRAAPEATRTALDALRALYDGPLRSATKAKAVAHAREALIP
jgi:hypothetical protein